MNTVNLIGRLTKDAEIRQTTKGDDVANFTVAIRRDAESTDFIDCVAFGKTAEIVRDYTNKGSLIGLDGRIQKRSYKTANGENRYIVEVIANRVYLLETKPKPSYEIKYEETLLEKKPIHQDIDYIPDADLPF